MRRDDPQWLRGFQTLGYAASILGENWIDWRYGPLWGDRPSETERAAYLRGLAGEPPPCGCVEKLRAGATQQSALIEAHRSSTWREALQLAGQRSARDAFEAAADVLEGLLAALGDTEAVE